MGVVAAAAGVPGTFSTDRSPAYEDDWAAFVAVDEADSCIGAAVALIEAVAVACSASIVVVQTNDAGVGRRRNYYYYCY